MRAMFHELVRHGRPVTLLYSVRCSEESAFAEVRSAQLLWMSPRQGLLRVLAGRRHTCEPLQSVSHLFLLSTLLAVALVG